MPENGQELYSIILKYLENIKFGSITLTIQDGKIVQIESCEKIRIPYILSSIANNGVVCSAAKSGCKAIGFARTV